MNYRIIPVTAFSQNCSLIWCEQTKLAALVDPGGDAEKIKQEVDASGVTLMQILLTHGHLDHVGAAAELAQHYGVPVIGPEKEDEFWLQGLPAQSRMFGLDECQPLTPDRWLNEGESVNVGNVTLQVLHCPGHTPGHILVSSTFRGRHRTTHAEAFAQVVGQGCAVAVAVLFQSATTGVVFAVNAAVFTLILQSKVQAINQTEEVLVTVSCNAVSTGLQEVVSTVGVAAEFWQYVSPGGDIVDNAVVTTVVERTCVSEFQTREGHTSPGLVVALVGVTLNLVFPLAVTGQLIVNLSFAFEADTHVGLIAISAFVIGEIVQTVDFTEQI